MHSARAILASASICVALLSAGQAAAQTRAPVRPRASLDAWYTYFGAGYQGMTISGVTAGSNLPTSLTAGVNVHVGERMGKYFALELGFSKADGSKTVTGATPYQTKLSVSTPTVDAYGFLPVAGSLSLVGTAGVGYATSHAENNGPTPFKVSKNDFAFRAGGGLEWRPVPGFGLQAIGRYQSMNSTIAKSGLQFMLGGNLYF
jgi:opacity protein-like surface antigen